MRVKQGVVAGVRGFGVSVLVHCYPLPLRRPLAPPIAVLNLRKVFASSEAGKNAQKEMEQKVKELQDKFKKDEDALVALQDEIEKKSSVWSEDKKQEKGIEFQKMRRDLRVKQEDAQMELKKLEEQQLGPIRKELEAGHREAGQGKRLHRHPALRGGDVFSDSVDITEEVTKAFNSTATQEIARPCRRDSTANAGDAGKTRRWSSAVNPLDFLRATPRTNCGACGHPTCLAFAVAVTKGGADPARCPHLAPGRPETIQERQAPGEGLAQVARGSGRAGYGARWPSEDQDP